MISCELWEFWCRLMARMRYWPVLQELFLPNLSTMGIPEELGLLQDHPCLQKNITARSCLWETFILAATMPQMRSLSIGNLVDEAQVFLSRFSLSLSRLPRPSTPFCKYYGCLRTIPTCAWAMKAVTLLYEYISTAFNILELPNLKAWIHKWSQCIIVAMVSRVG